jgi:hypothetical protein
MIITQNDINRFYSHIITDWKNNPNLCWKMDYYKDKDGYNVMSLNSQNEQAHRISYVMHKKQIFKSDQINHTCHNYGCVNPNHLYAGTHIENMSDMVKSNRQAKGSHIGLSKLTEEKVKEMLIDIWNDEYDFISEIASFYNISVLPIREILYGRGWEHVTDLLKVPLENIRKKVINNKVRKGIDISTSQINEDIARLIKIGLKNNQSCSSLALKFDVSNRIIYNIKNNVSWKHVKI